MVITRLFKSLLWAALLFTGNSLATDANDFSVHLRGVVVPAKKIKLSFAQPGVVKALAGGGALVTSGEMLGKLDDKKARYQLAQATAEYRSAESELAQAQHSRDKNGRLVEQDILSDIALVESGFSVTVATEKLAVARARRDIAQAALADCVVLAPFDGAVAVVNINQGEWAKAGEPFMEFVNLNQLLLSIDIPPQMIGELAVGLTTDVVHDGQIVGQAEVKTIFPVIDPASGLRRIVWHVYPQDGVLLSGRYVSLASWPATAKVEQ